MSKMNKLEIAKWVVDHARREGAGEVAVRVSRNRNINVKFRDGKLDELKESTRNSLNVSIYKKNRYSSHSTNDFRKESLKKFISDAVASTGYLSKDEYRKLPDSRYYPQGGKAKTKQVDKVYDKIESDKRIDIAKKIYDSASRKSNLIISTSASYSDGLYESVLVHSNGFEGESQSTSFWSGAVVTVKDKNEGRPMDWYFAGGKDFSDLLDEEKIAAEAVKGALRKIGQKKIKSGKYDMLVDNRIVQRLGQMIYSPLRGRNLQQKRSYLEGMLGKQIASDKLSIIDDPTLIKGLNFRKYDGEGLAAVKREIINDGILKNYYIDYYYGQKLGMEPTSGSLSNVVIAPGKRSQEEMIKIIGKGIFVTGFIGGNFNSTTGDFSFGIIGMKIEKGKLVQPVNEMNISGNSKDFWMKLIETGNDIYPYSSLQAPSLLFENIQFSGI